MKNPTLPGLLLRCSTHRVSSDFQTTLPLPKEKGGFLGKEQIPIKMGLRTLW